MSLLAMRRAHPTIKPIQSIPEPHDLAALLAQALDAEADDVAGLQEFRRLLALSDPGRRAGRDHVARLEHHELRHVGDDMRDGEDHGDRKSTRLNSSHPS